IQEMKQRKRVKTYLNSLGELDQLFSKKLEEVDKSTSLIDGILSGNTRFDFSELANRRGMERTQLLEDIQKQFPGSNKGGRSSGRKRSGRKKDGRSTYDITLEMWNKKMDIESIAKERGLVPGTIEGHLAKAVQTGRINISQFISEEEIREISDALKSMPDGFSSKDLFSKLDGKFSYAKLRAVMSHNVSKPE
ncbi:MAG: helix-turn-helix domain-containing protein, partial [Cyclobacteriaceae bacterium]